MIIDLNLNKKLVLIQIIVYNIIGGETDEIIVCKVQFFQKFKR